MNLPSSGSNRHFYPPECTFTNECSVGSCSSLSAPSSRENWIGRESGYADFAPDDLREPPQGVLVVDQPEAANTLVGNSRRSNCPPKSRCQFGPVDVEDLALYFDSGGGEKIQRSNREEISNNTPCGIINTPYVVQGLSTNYSTPNQPTEKRQTVDTCFSQCQYSNFDRSCDKSCNQCLGGPYPLCPEELWLQCPVSDHCPIYNAVPTAGISPASCIYENPTLPSWFYLCPDAQSFEDYLSNEKRKERSRDAARCRRSKETDIFSELASALPMSMEQAAHLDKASVMRLAIAYLKVRAVVDSIPAPITAKSESAVKMDCLFPKALNGFMIVLSSDGNMVYLSENVSEYLGVSQMDMMGQSVYEYSHPCDHEELRECLSSKSIDDNGEKRACNFFLRLKCTLTSKGRKVNLKSASYKVIHCIGRLANIRDTNSNSIELKDEERENSKPREKEEDEDDDDDEEEFEFKKKENGIETSLVLVGSPIPHPSNIEMPLGRHTFLSKHNLNMKFTYADEKLAEYLGWDSEELMGQSVFEFYHALDNFALDKSFKSLFSKGQCETVAYRFLSKRGGYAWVVTQATLIHCSKQHKPLSVVCVNYILSGVERENEVYSARQLAARNIESSLKTNEGSRIVEEKTPCEKKKKKEKQLPAAGEAAEKSADEGADVAVARVVVAANEPSTTRGAEPRKEEELELQLSVRAATVINGSARKTAAITANTATATATASSFIADGPNPEDNSFDSEVNLERQISVVLQEQFQQVLRCKDSNRTKPLTVTTSTFRPAVGFDSRKKTPRLIQDGSRKDNTFPRPVQVAEKTLFDAPLIKEQFENGSLKENDKPEPQLQPLQGQKLQQTQQQPRLSSRTLPDPANRPTFIFQGKPALEYRPPETAVCRTRPQTVTKQLFTSLSSSAATNQQQQLQEQLPCRPVPQTATASIFAPRTEDMNKGFLTFSEDQPGLTMLKDEPEDLTHLAPTPGDVCVPLEDTPFLSDMLEEFILDNENYCPLLSPSETLPSADFGDAMKEAELVDTDRRKTLEEPLTDIAADSDPFIYGDPVDSPPVVNPNVVSPSLAKFNQSPEHSGDSLDSPTTGSMTEAISEDEMLMMGISDTIAEEELEFRAPYIPMSDQDETLEQLISDEMVMWGAHQPTKKSSLSSSPSSSISASLSPSISSVCANSSSSSNASSCSSPCLSPSHTKWLCRERAHRSEEPSLVQLLKGERTPMEICKTYNDREGGLVNPSQVLGQIPRKATTSQLDCWLPKSGRTTIDRPNKRPHSIQVASSVTENQSKRLKCDRRLTSEFADGSFALEEHLSPERHRISFGKHQPGGINLASSQLLRRLVSEQTTLDTDYSDVLTKSSINDHNSISVLTVDTDIEPDLSLGFQEAEVDAGGGGGEDITRQTHRPHQRGRNRSNPGTACSSVLMNLLVSGCDDQLEENCDVPTLLTPPNSLMSPLSVNLDNQLVPQGPSSSGPSSFEFEQLNTSSGKPVAKLDVPLAMVAGMHSPSSPISIMNYEHFDYDPGAGLLQVNPEFFGTLLDQNLV